jgi:hypothetical protein
MEELREQLAAAIGREFDARRSLDWDTQQVAMREILALHRRQIATDTHEMRDKADAAEKDTRRGVGSWVAI